uniref:Uncharacterized protein n=1 Tax=Arundo donax TaxID=35708 RepID=A0A0A9B557_ARUDO
MKCPGGGFSPRRLSFFFMLP